jgi:hypothetical protein
LRGKFHIIGGVKASYSSDYTVFRELLQNANDAGATAVEIIYHQDTDSAQQATVLEVRNNGKPFSADDWLRLRRIAEGNPNVDKVSRAHSFTRLIIADWLFWRGILLGIFRVRRANVRHAIMRRHC